MRHGVHLESGGRAECAVWAPFHAEVAIRVLERDEIVPLDPVGDGWHRGELAGVHPGDRYMVCLSDGRVLPDPASRHQPEGVHGPSAIVDLAATAPDRLARMPTLDDLVIYELHVGTFTPEGTFDAAVRHLGDLADLGVTAVELMPVAQFPGRRNWGYDGVFPYAVQHSYGGPDGLSRFVDAAHGAGLAVILDVVYNHVGPEGNVLGQFGPYFTDAYRTPWGDAINFDGPESPAVRRFFVDNALMWVDEYGIDGLRLDAVHAIVDAGARPLVEELTTAVHRRAERDGRRALVIAEDAHNDPRLTVDRRGGGLGLDAQWNDDYHHAIHALLTGERDGYYADFGGVDDVAACLRHGFAYGGRYSPFRRRIVGRPPGDPPVASRRLVGFAQNHDQIGNRARGDRLGELVGSDARRLAAALVTLSPFVPLLFMGEEYGETAPFLYFVDHGDPDLLDAVRAGRRSEFEGFGWDPDEIPDPAAEATFRQSVLDRSRADADDTWAPLGLYRRLLDLRRDLALGAEGTVDVSVAGGTITISRPLHATPSVVVANCGGDPVRVPAPPGVWHAALDTAASRWGGPGSETADVVKSDGSALIHVAARAAVLLARGEAASSSNGSGGGPEGRPA